MGAVISPVGWFMITVFLTILIFNMVIIAYYVTIHLRLFFKRHHKKLLKFCKSLTLRKELKKPE